MGFNSAFKGLIVLTCMYTQLLLSFRKEYKQIKHISYKSPLYFSPPLKAHSTSNYLAKIKEATIQWKAITTTTI